MMITRHMHKADRLFAGALCVSMRSDRRPAILTVNYGWNFALGSSVT